MLFKSVDTATNGEEALSLYNAHNYNLVITDISMPKVNGFELIKKIKEQNKLQKTIIISAYNTQEYKDTALKLKIDGFLLKPIEMTDIVKILTNVLKEIKTDEI